MERGGLEYGELMVINFPESPLEMMVSTENLFSLVPVPPLVVDGGGPCLGAIFQGTALCLSQHLPGDCSTFPLLACSPPPPPPGHGRRVRPWRALLPARWGTPFSWHLPPGTRTIGI